MPADGRRPGSPWLRPARALGPADWPLWRDLRLRALQDSPEAFCATYADESARTDQEWQAALQRPGVHWVVTAAPGACGDTAAPGVAIAGAFPTSADGPLEMFSVWVAPQARRLGAGRALVEAAVEAAAGAGRPGVQLWVRAANGPARRMYERCGFVLTDVEHGQGPLRELLLSRASD